MKRKLEGTNSGDKQATSYGSQAHLSDLRAELAGAGRGSKASIARVLSILNSRGQLVDNRLGGSDEGRPILRAARKCGDANTPYGGVVQRIKLNDGYMLECVHIVPHFIICR